MQTSARYGVQYPSADRTDAPDIPTHLANIVNGLEQSAMFGQGPIASRPVSTGGTPGKTGRIYASTDETPQRLYYDYGTGWFQVGALAAGAIGSTELADNAVTQAKMADNSVGSAEMIDGSVGSAEILDGSVTAAEIAAALKPSQGAGAAAEALRALGTAAGLAAAGTHAAQHQPGGADVLTLEGRQTNWHAGSSPPASPADGDHWLFPADAANGTYWHFRYDSSQTTYKWVFIGGPPMQGSSLSDIIHPGADNWTWMGPVMTTARAGDYIFRAGMSCVAPPGGHYAVMAIAPNAVTRNEVTDPGCTQESSSGTEEHSLSAEMRWQGLAAGVSHLVAARSNTSVAWRGRWMEVLPIRVI